MINAKNYIINMNNFTLFPILFPLFLQFSYFSFSKFFYIKKENDRNICSDDIILYNNNYYKI